LLVAELPSTDHRASLLDARGKAKRRQHAHAVGVDQEAGPYSLPGLSPLDEFDREAALVKRRGRGQACHTSADDQDRVDLCHASLRSR
jgi:hypothetical protein